MGYQLKKSNPTLAELLARQSMYDHSAAMPELYPQQIGERPTDRPELRRKPAPASIPKRLSLLDDQLAIYFGRTSDAGKTQALARANPLLYEGSRERAIEVGLLPPIRARIRRK